MKNIIIFILLLLLNSYMNHDEFIFINKIINEPDSLESIVKKSNFLYGKNEYSKRLLKYIDEKILLIKEFQYEFLKNGYRILEDSIIKISDRYHGYKDSTDSAHIIILKGVTGDKLMFLWQKIEEKWELEDIERDQSSDFDKEKDGFIRNVMKSPDSLVSYLKKTNFTYAKHTDSVRFFKEMSLNIEIIKKFQDEFLKDSMEIHPGNIFEDMYSHNKIPDVYYNILIESKNGEEFDFLWKKDGDKWEFIKINRKSQY